ncbi:MAG: signal peptidase I [Cyclobacteriaceae bacterium]|nr:signal peptidase I [Cyclobacteriaceae bacterium HetDA_MAG_MS6]
MGWLIFGVLVFSVSLYIVVRLKSSFLKYLCLFFWVFWFTLTLRLFCFELYYVSSDSMRDTLRVGDKILINKLRLGPLLPDVNDVPILNWFSFSNESAPIKRLSGYGTVRMGDIIMFHIYDDQGNEVDVIKRCMATPGDTLQILDGLANINGIDKKPLLSERISVMIFSADTKGILSALSDNAHVLNQEINSVVLELSRSELERLKSSGLIDSISYDPFRLPEGKRVFPWSHKTDWTLNNYGPIVAPFKGMQVHLDSYNSHLYWYTIASELKDSVRLVDDRVWVNDRILDTHVFNEDYFFVLGDNRDHSMDSRVIGFIAQRQIVGIVCFH